MTHVKIVGSSGPVLVVYEQEKSRDMFGTFGWLQSALKSADLHAVSAQGYQLMIGMRMGRFVGILNSRPCMHVIARSPCPCKNMIE